MTGHARFRTLAMLLAAPVAAVSDPAIAAPVAFVEAPRGVSNLATVIKVVRGTRPVPVKGRYLNLEPGDTITLRDAKAQVAVRYLGNNALVWVRRVAGTPASDPDYRVRAPEVPGLTQAVFTWLVTQVVGSGDGRPPQEITASSRSVRGALPGCAALVDGKPASLQFRGPAGRPSRVVAGGAPLPVAWLGGAAPYALELSGASMPTAAGACFAMIDGAVLRPGPAALALRDGSGHSVALPLEVVASRPAMPAVLASAAIDDTSRQLYYATWLHGLDGGVWALEAQRIVASRDCTLPAVKAWLDAAGLRASCD